MAQGEPDAGVLGVEDGQRRGQPERVGRRRGDARVAAHDARVLVHRRPGGGHLGQDRVRALEQVGARRGQLDALRRPRQQQDAELLLEAADLLRDRGLREVQGVGGPGHVPMPGDRGEGLELAQVHGGAQATGARLPSRPRELRA